MPRDPLIINTDRGLYCPRGEFHIDAWRPVPRSVVSHAHSDHARWGCERYLTAAAGVKVLQKRMGDRATVDAVQPGETIDLNGVKLSLYPAGHVLGSSQVRVEHDGEVWVFTGDYKRQNDPTCASFEPLRCDTLITECTFGLPIFRWRDSDCIAADINAWWRENMERERTSLILAYSLGKAQRVLSMLDPSVGPILLHGAVHGMVETYRASGVALPPTEYASVENAKLHKGRAMVIAPPSALNGPWARKFSPVSAGIASGWMQVRGFRRRKAADRGFVLSDHVDWPSLLKTIEECEAEQIIATHGFTSVLVKYLAVRGKSASAFATRFKNEGEEDEGEREIDPALEQPELALAEADATRRETEPAGSDETTT